MKISLEAVLGSITVDNQLMLKSARDGSHYIVLFVLLPAAIWELDIQAECTTSVDASSNHE
jgi:hypothetical protein